MAATTDTEEPAPTKTNEVVTTVARRAEEGVQIATTRAVITKVASNPDVVVSHSKVIVLPPAKVTSKSSVSYR